MKNKVKNIILIFIGILVGICLSFTTPIKASIQEYILYKADYNILVNGEEYFHPELPILNYKGHTYAPFRSILEFAGLDVNWNAELRQAEVNNPINRDEEVPDLPPSDNKDTLKDSFILDDGSTVYVYYCNNIISDSKKFGSHYQWYLVRNDEYYVCASAFGSFFKSYDDRFEVSIPDGKTLILYKDNLYKDYNYIRYSHNNNREEGYYKLSALGLTARFENNTMVIENN